MRNMITAAGLVFSSFWIMADAEAQKLRYKNDDFSIKLQGRLHYDMLLDSDAPEQDQMDEDWRRVRLALKTTWKKDWRFAVSGDFADGDARLRYLRLDYRGWPVHLSVGHLQESFGLSSSTSSNYMALMERPLPTLIGPQYGTGIKANYRLGDTQTTVGVFGSGNSDFEFDDESSFDGEMASWRTSGKLFHKDDVLVHAGFSYSWREPDEDTSLRFRRRPETILVDGFSISHPSISGAKSNDSYGLEFAFRHGSKMLQAEYFNSTVSRSTGSDIQFDGYYVEGSWVLTGERRGYKTRYGTFGGVKPKRPVTKGGLGAWEIALRYSTLDLRDRVAIDDIDGEIGEVIALGVNWYINKKFRVMVNALQISEDNGTRVDEAEVIQARFQYRF